MTKKFSCSVNGRDKLHNSTSNVYIQRQRLEKIIKVWLIGSRDSYKELFFSTRNFKVILKISKTNTSSLLGQDLQCFSYVAGQGSQLNVIQSQ